METSITFPAQDVSTEAFLNPAEVLDKWDVADSSSFTALFGQQHCVLLSPNFYCNIFFLCGFFTSLGN